MEQDEKLRRIVYTSRAVGSNLRSDREAIFAASRRNNGIDGITGILWAEADRYLQLLEGSPEAVESAFERISADPRHNEIAVLDQGSFPTRLFPEWAMAGLPAERPVDAKQRLRSLLRNAPPEILGFFRDLK